MVAKASLPSADEEAVWEVEDKRKAWQSVSDSSTVGETIVREKFPHFGVAYRAAYANI